ncbi:UNVERIFIED_CONTAM: hypothetical protein Slati_3730100 [Sesamum latifolium]|uniref:CCHC-type domain-containing protein n=1 Tax=Sesamum latifolium TaxID=2727402 RepID=A0AAW2U3G8_9LAMI
METELTRLGKTLVLTEEEDLVGRILSHKPYNVDALKTILLSSLNPAKGIEVTFIENGRFLLKFHHPIDRARVLDSGTWALDKNLIVLAIVAENENSAEVDLTWCEFHVRIHGLPIRKMTVDIARFIGGRIGRLQDSDQDNSAQSWGSYMRIQVALDVSKPLPRALKLRTVLGDEQLVFFTYERLPNFCYLCGRIGHISRWCEVRFQADFVDPGENAPYGPWLRAIGRMVNRTWFPTTRNTPEHMQPLRPRFNSRHASSQPPISIPKRGCEVFGSFGSSVSGPSAPIKPVSVEVPPDAAQLPIPPTAQVQLPLPPPHCAPPFTDPYPDDAPPHCVLPPTAPHSDNALPQGDPPPTVLLSDNALFHCVYPPAATHSDNVPPTLSPPRSIPLPTPLSAQHSPSSHMSSSSCLPTCLNARLTSEPVSSLAPSLLTKRKLLNETSPSDDIPLSKRPSRNTVALADISNQMVEAASQPHQAP